MSGERRRSHGTQLLPPHPLGLFSAMTPSSPAQPRRSTRLAKLQVAAAAKQKLTDGWAALPPELLAKVFEALLAVLQEEEIQEEEDSDDDKDTDEEAAVLEEEVQEEEDSDDDEETDEEEIQEEEGLPFCMAVAVVREVCTGWQAVHDALVKRLVFDWPLVYDKDVRALVQRFPAVTSVQFKVLGGGHEITDEAVLALCNLRSLTSLDLSWCWDITDKAMRAVSNVNSLTYLNLNWCKNVTDDGVLALSSLPALTRLDIAPLVFEVTDEGVRALHAAAPALRIEYKDEMWYRHHQDGDLY